MVKSGVHIINRLYADGQRAYTVRWCCPKTRRYKSRKVGPDRLLAEEERRRVVGELRRGGTGEPNMITWSVHRSARRCSGSRIWRRPRFETPRIP